MSLCFPQLFGCRAAFQYGVKMSDGRKTCRQGAKNDKVKLNREWQQISQVSSLLVHKLYLFCTIDNWCDFLKLCFILMNCLQILQKRKVKELET